MDYVDYTVQKTKAILAEIERLSASEFPYRDAREALELLKSEIFEKRLLHIGLVADSPDTKIKQQLCSKANIDNFRFLPILGFVLRSTNVRSSFEVFAPLLRLSRQFLGDETKLVLSSEWDFSPLTYPLVFEQLPHFVFIGMPATESGNALILPLAGHELGHSVWRNRSLPDRFTPILQERINEAFASHWPRYQEVTGQKGVSIKELSGDLLFNRDVSQASKVALKQTEEIFCDIFGLRIFGPSYIDAFHYLLGPGFGSRRGLHYPALKTRVSFINRAAEYFGIPFDGSAPETYFEKPGQMDQRAQFLLAISEEAIDNSVPTIIESVTEICSSVPVYDASAYSHIVTAFKSAVPTDRAGSLPNVLNAAWVAYKDPATFGSLAHDKKVDYLNELVLKTIEVMEYEIKTV